MNDGEDIESAVVQFARRKEEAVRDARWDALAAGGLSTDEQSALRELDPALYEAFRPPAEGERAAMTERVLDVGRVGAARRLTWRRARAGLGIFAIAAAIGVLWLTRPPEAPLPRYELALSGEVWTAGDPAIRVVATRAAPLEIVLRPATRVTGPVGFLAFLARDGEVRAWRPDAQVRDTGAVGISGPIEVLFAGVPAGRWELLVAVGRPDALDRSAGEIESVARQLARTGTLPPAVNLPAECTLLRAALQIEAGGGATP